MLPKKYVRAYHFGKRDLIIAHIQLYHDGS